MVDSVAVIHLEKAVERLPIIEGIRALFPAVSVYMAKDGTEWENNTAISKQHPWTGGKVSRGVIGCAHSHIDLIHAALKRGDKTLIIFEDDCVMTEGLTSQDIMKYVHGANMLDGIQAERSWDILLLGANEYVESEATSSPDYMAVKRFWGTHAMILREGGMRAALLVFAEEQKKGIFLPADWMYNAALKQGLKCYGPAGKGSLCRQKEGLISHITGSKR